MALLTTYTEGDLVAFMRTTIGGAADILGWTHSHHYEQPVTSTLIACDAVEVEDVTDIEKLRAIARREVWQAVYGATAPMYNLTMPSGERLERAQLHAQAAGMYRQASAEAARYEGGYVVSATRVYDGLNPYTREA